jgi:hypothetical protein
VVFKLCEAIVPPEAKMSCASDDSFFLLVSAVLVIFTYVWVFLPKKCVEPTVCCRYTFCQNIVESLFRRLRQIVHAFMICSVVAVFVFSFQPMRDHVQLTWLDQLLLGLGLIVLVSHLAAYAQEIVIICATPALLYPYWSQIQADLSATLGGLSAGWIILMVVIALLLIGAVVVSAARYVEALLLLHAFIVPVLVILAIRVLTIEGHALSGRPSHLGVDYQNLNEPWPGKFECASVDYFQKTANGTSLYCGPLFCCGLMDADMSMDNRCPLYWDWLSWLLYVLLFLPRFAHWCYTTGGKCFTKRENHPSCCCWFGNDCCGSNRTHKKYAVVEDSTSLVESVPLSPPRV